MSEERRLWWRWLNRIAIIVGAAVLIVYGIDAGLAISRNEIVVGVNYWGQPLFAVLQLVVVVVATPFLMIYAIRHWNSTKPPRFD